MTGSLHPETPERRIFILRMWQESPGSAIWRGQIQDVHNGHTIAIPDARDLLECIQSQSQRDNPPGGKRQGLK
ncbi:MAG: hypothetical protein JW862_02155 [Anaerolineales bacterium]|nr:hypothetical protein [Anaerolineales bacterium]